jgi:AraC-like DNA-binding protein
LNLALAISCFFMSILILVHNIKKNVANYFLSLIIFIIGLIFFNIHALIKEDLVYISAILLVHFSPIYLLFGPFIYIYVQFFLYKKYRFSYVDLIHLAPALFLLINEIPYLLIPFSEKLILARLVQLDHRNLYNIQLAFINVKMINIFIISTYLFYLIYCFTLFYRVRESESINGMTTPVVYKREIKWLFSFLFFLILIFGGLLLLFIREVIFTSYFFLLISGIGILFLIITLIFYPYIIYGAKFMIKPLEIIKNSTLLLQNRLLIQKQLIHIDTLVAIFMVDLPYTRNDFNLNRVSLKLGIPKHHLTYYLNIHLNLSFNSWRDQLRIIYAKGLISKGEAKSLTLESIGKQAGFQSRDKFTRAFNAQTGSNPSDFLKNQKNLTPLY